MPGFRFVNPTNRVFSRGFKFVNYPNRVIEHQKFYQKAYRNHTRIWRINPRSNYLLYPYYLLFGVTLSSCMWMMGRMVLGHRTWWGKG